MPQTHTLMCLPPASLSHLLCPVESKQGLTKFSILKTLVSKLGYIEIYIQLQKMNMVPLPVYEAKLPF